MKLIIENWRNFTNEAKNEDGKEQGVDGKACWKGKKYAGSVDTDGDGEADKDKCVPMDEEQEFLEEETDKDRMKCNSPRYIKQGEPGYGKKQKVVKSCKGGKEKIIRFGDANLEDRSDNPERKSNFRARHKCSEKKDIFTAGYWSCKEW